MPAILMFLFVLLVVIAISFGLFWVVGQMKLPEPLALYARIIVGILSILLLLGLFIPGLGVSLPSF